MSAGPTWPLLAVIGRVWPRFFVRAGKIWKQNVKEPIHYFSHREKFRMFSGEDHSTGMDLALELPGTAARLTRNYLLNARDAIKHEHMMMAEIFGPARRHGKLLQGRSVHR